MASSTDPRAAGFNAVEFRDAIRFAMHMGLPESTVERATFQWTRLKTYEREDPSGQPYSWAAAPTTDVIHPDVQVPVAMEFQRYSSGEGQTSVGQFQTTSVVLTLLDEDYALVAGADKALLGDNTYTLEYVAPPLGLFEVTIYQLFMRAEDES